MKRVGYDNNFQRELTEKYAVWVPPPPKKKNQKTKKLPKRESGTVSKTKPSTSQKTRKKEPKVEETFEDARNVKSGSDDDLEYVDPPVTRSLKRKRESSPEAKLHSGSEPDGGPEYVDLPPASRSRKSIQVDIDVDVVNAVNGESDDDLEYDDHPVSLPRKKRSATPDAVPDIGSGSDDDLEYVDSPVVSCPDEVISIADTDEMLAPYKLTEGTFESPIYL